MIQTRLIFKSQKFLRADLDQKKFKTLGRKTVRFFCPFELCDQSYSRRQRLKIHCYQRHKADYKIQRIKESEENRKLLTEIFGNQIPFVLGFECLMCGKIFSEKYNLKVHQRLHTGDRPYQCDLCEKSFAILGNYNDHRRRHSKTKPYQCSDCGKQYYRRYLLDRHVQSQRGNCKISGRRTLSKQMVTGMRSNQLFELEIGRTNISSSDKQQLRQNSSFITHVQNQSLDVLSPATTTTISQNDQLFPPESQINEHKFIQADTYMQQQRDKNQIDAILNYQAPNTTGDSLLNGSMVYSDLQSHYQDEQQLQMHLGTNVIPTYDDKTCRNNYEVAQELSRGLTQQQSTNAPQFNTIQNNLAPRESPPSINVPHLVIDTPQKFNQQPTIEIEVPNYSNNLGRLHSAKVVPCPNFIKIEDDKNLKSCIEDSKLVQHFTQLKLRQPIASSIPEIQMNNQRQLAQPLIPLFSNLPGTYSRQGLLNLINCQEEIQKSLIDQEIKNPINSRQNEEAHFQIMPLQSTFDHQQIALQNHFLNPHGQQQTSQIYQQTTFINNEQASLNNENLIRQQIINDQDLNSFIYLQSDGKSHQRNKISQNAPTMTEQNHFIFPPPKLSQQLYTTQTHLKMNSNCIAHNAQTQTPLDSLNAVFSKQPLYPSALPTSQHDASPISIPPADLQIFTSSNIDKNLQFQLTSKLFENSQRQNQKLEQINGGINVPKIKQNIDNCQDNETPLKQIEWDHKNFNCCQNIEHTQKLQEPLQYEQNLRQSDLSQFKMKNKLPKLKDFQNKFNAMAQMSQKCRSSPYKANFQFVNNHALDKNINQTVKDLGKFYNRKAVDSIQNQQSHQPKRYCTTSREDPLRRIIFDKLIVKESTAWHQNK